MTQQTDTQAKPVTTRVRLAAPRKQLERTIQKMTKLADSPMKPEKLVDLLTQLSTLQVKLLDMDTGSRHDALVEENETLKTELAALRDKKSENDDLTRRLQVFREQDRDKALKLAQVDLADARRKVEESAIEKSEVQFKNTQLTTANTELTRRVETLEQKNAVLQDEIDRLNARTPDELITEVKKMTGL